MRGPETYTHAGVNQANFPKTANPKCLIGMVTSELPREVQLPRQHSQVFSQSLIIGAATKEILRSLLEARLIPINSKATPGSASRTTALQPAFPELLALPSQVWNEN